MNEALRRLSEQYWEHRLRTFPTTALLLGDHRYDDQMEDLSLQAEDEHIAALEGFADEAEQLHPDALDADERVTRAVLIEETRGEAAVLRTRPAEFDVSPSTGLHVALLQAVGQFALLEQDHADAVAVKFERLEAAFEQAVQRLRQGLAKDRTPPEVAVSKSITQIDAYLESPLESDPFVNVPAPPPFSTEQTAKWRGRLATVVADHVRPAYAAYRAALAEEVAPRARPAERCGVAWLPDGAAVYDVARARHTSLDRPAHLIHETGRELIEALADEYRTMAGTALGTTDLAEIFARLRHDPALRFERREEIVAAARSAMERARAAIPDWFGKLPIADCVMAEVPEPGAREAPIAYYFPPATDRSRPGMFFVNTGEPETRTRFESEALAFHESIPGHHLQIAIAQELDAIPEFRKHARANGYTEGWGLYTERLADEMGLYSNDVARLGMLSFDSWRAGRLVVDTGMHALGWSRQEAIDWMLVNTPQAPNNIETEIDRYIGWPGQALGYMLGRTEIARLRRDAEQRLDGAFDIRGFHDVALGSGPVPLHVLGELVDTWVRNAKNDTADRNRAG